MIFIQKFRRLPWFFQCFLWAIVALLISPFAYVGITEIAARNGLPESQIALGRFYEKGQWFYPKDRNKALEWYRKAALRGSANGQYTLGLLYAREGDNDRAFNWYRRSATQSWPSAQHNLAICYLKGLGTPKNSDRAIYWFDQAARNGNTGAQFNLGVSYLKGRGVLVDTEKAVFWITKSAEAGTAVAQAMLALLYGEGRVVDQDLEKAMAWATEARDNGVNHSGRLVKLIEKSESIREPVGH